MSIDFAPLSLGTPRRHWSGSRFGVTESLHAPQQTLARHAHRNADITVVLEGGFETKSRNDAMVTSVHDMLFLPSGLDHSNIFAPSGTRTLIIELPPIGMSMLSDEVLFPECMSVVPASISGHLSQRIRRAFEDELSDFALNFEELAHECLDLFLKQHTRRCSRATSPWLLTVAESLRQHFRKPPSLVELGRSFSVHPIHLARVFRAHHGCSIGEFVGRVRVDRAVQSLANTDCSVAHIADESGFYDQSHLTRIFKRHIGVTPSRYRYLARRSEIDDTALRSYNLSQQ